MISVAEGVSITKEIINAFKAYRKRKNEAEFNKIAIELIQKEPYNFALTFYTGLLCSYKKELEKILIKQIKNKKYQNDINKIVDDIADTNLKFSNFLKENYEELIDLVNISKWLLFFSNKFMSIKNPIELVKIFKKFYEKAFIHSSSNNQGSLMTALEIILKIPKIGDNLNEPMITPVKDDSNKEFDENDIIIQRGGDWKIENDESVYYYKVKITNNSHFVISSITIILTSIPPGLERSNDRIKVGIVKFKSFISHTFKLICKESCVGNEIEGVVTFRDIQGEPHTMSIPPLELKYECNLLVPKQISVEEYGENIASMGEKEVVIESDLNKVHLESEIENLLKGCNFAILSQEQGSMGSKINAYAQGMYDHEDVALSVNLQDISNETTKLIIKAMSDREEKLMDLLKDINEKCDDLKSTNELILEYSGKIENVLDSIEDPSLFLTHRLGENESNKIIAAWEDYKKGKINKKEFIMEGVKTSGKKFLKAFIGKI
ncbi:MAG: hypothetical protein ACFFAT_08545 [Promethearchaeota archaeon]